METLYVLEIKDDRTNQWRVYTNPVALLNREEAERELREIMETRVWSESQLRIGEYQRKVKLAAPKVVITMEGGVIQNVITSRPTKVAVIDYDTDGAVADDLTPIPQGEGEDHIEAYASIWDDDSVTTNLPRVRQLLTAIEER